MTNDEFIILCQWRDMPPVKKVVTPMPATPLMQKLVVEGFLEPITRPNAMDPSVQVVTGYDVTVAGVNAIKRYIDKGIST